MYTPIENKVVGEAISKLRLHKNKKAKEIATYLELSESAYTKYERGESAITISFVNKVAQFFDVHPIELIQNTPENIIENIHNSNVSIQTNNSFTNFSKEILVTMSKLIEVKDKQIEHGNLQILTLLEIIKIHSLEKNYTV